jgi:hypothetical protein
MPQIISPGDVSRVRSDMRTERWPDLRQMPATSLGAIRVTRSPDAAQHEVMRC